jgi:hypothetical protein
MLQSGLEHALIRSMRTSEVLEVFGGSKRAVAEALGISISAVYQWDETVPPTSAIRLAMIRPDLRYDPEFYRGWNAKFAGTRKRKSKRH